ncbi:MAG TPA: RDD family protein [Caulifigura sp.]|nr:RDD family protein [Caulifigura sp.]
MPIKVRCGGCDKALNVPDSMRGKTVKCPACGVRIKVSGGDEGETTTVAKAPRKKKETEAAPDDKLSGEIFANLNLKQLEAEEKICPFCAEPMPSGEDASTVCPSCGMDTATGKMDKKEARRRARRGPDIKEYWTKAWSDPFHFILEYKSLAFRTGTFWTQFGMCFAICLFMAKDYTERGPIVTFWSALTAITMLGIPGWYWSLAIKLIQTELFREKVNTDRIHFDFFANVSIGLRGVIWPFVVFLPAWLGLGLIYLVSPSSLPEQTFRIAAGVLLLLPFVTFPLATIHMTARYTYKAWILWELLVTFARAAAGCFYWLLQAAVIMGPVFAVMGAIQVKGGGLNPFSNTYVDQWAVGASNWAMGIIGEKPDPESIINILIRIFVELVIGFCFIAPLAYVSAFPALYMIRANALLAKYFQPKLGIMNDMPRDRPATFWVRFLAFWGDMLLVPLSSFLVMRDKRAVIVGQLLNAALVLTKIFRPEATGMFQILGVLFVLYNFWMYFAVSESGAVKATTIKEAFGLVVQSTRGKQLTLQQATTRWFGTMLSVLTGGLGFVICAFHPKKQAIQDLISKSQVVWIGDK